MFSSVDEIYNLVETIISECEQAGFEDVASDFQKTYNLGSSSLEILGYIRTTILRHKSVVEGFVTKADVDNAIRFIDRSFGHPS